MLFRKKATPIATQPSHMIVGLGNPGPEYAGTRHNVGFDVVEALARDAGRKIETRKHKAVFGLAEIDGIPLLLVRPLTFMNLSGQAVAALAREHRIPPDKILVVADDLDLDVGRVRLKPKGGAGGHNGHRSIIQSLGTTEYPRLRIGIGKGSDPTIEHVLSRFKPEEREAIHEAIAVAVEACRRWLTEGVERTASWVNVRKSDSDSD
ncbi:MAG TPA: aminoacyl-tRNA hydrolase [Fimbriimonadaceae bacterium]|nr:aminoacyl-tRNA hydrolase [Fimbriimonadaceae bacterium]